MNQNTLTNEIENLNEKIDAQTSLLVSIRAALYILVTFAMVGFIIALVMIMMSVVQQREAESELDKTTQIINGLHDYYD